MDTEDKSNVVTLGVMPKVTAKAELHMVDKWNLSACQHGDFLVDETKAEVECGICKEKLNPMWVLNRIAQADSNFRREHARLRAVNQIMKEKMENRTRCKCQHCGKMTRIKVDFSDYELVKTSSEIQGV